MDSLPSVSSPVSPSTGSKPTTDTPRHKWTKVAELVQNLQQDGTYIFGRDERLKELHVAWIKGTTLSIQTCDNYYRYSPEKASFTGNQNGDIDPSTDDNAYLLDTLVLSLGKAADIALSSQALAPKKKEAPKIEPPKKKEDSKAQEKPKATESSLKTPVLASITTGPDLPAQKLFGCISDSLVAQHKGQVEIEISSVIYRVSRKTDKGAYISLEPQSKAGIKIELSQNQDGIVLLGKEKLDESNPAQKDALAILQICAKTLKEPVKETGVKAEPERQGTSHQWEDVAFTMYRLIEVLNLRKEGYTFNMEGNQYFASLELEGDIGRLCIQLRIPPEGPTGYSQLIPVENFVEKEGRVVPEKSKSDYNSKLLNALVDNINKHKSILIKKEIPIERACRMIFNRLKKIPSLSVTVNRKEMVFKCSEVESSFYLDGLLVFFDPKKVTIEGQDLNQAALAIRLCANNIKSSLSP